MSSLVLVERIEEEEAILFKSHCPNNKGLYYMMTETRVLNDYQAKNPKKSWVSASMAG